MEQPSPIFTMMVDDTAPTAVYQPNTLKYSLHSGQRKLIVGEIHFLTKYGHLSKDVLYVGAAQGNHIPLLARMFPGHNFELWDPMPFAENLVEEARVNERLKLVRKYFTAEDATTYAGKNVLFICDIRTTAEKPSAVTAALADKLVKEAEGELWEGEIMFNMEQQRAWLNVIKPAMSMLKFRLPYPDDERTRLAKQHAGKPLIPDTVEYLDGELMFQCWAPQSSTECRLITDGSRTRIYDVRRHEQVMYYFNTRTRLEWYPHGVTGVHGIDHCHDCMGEITILRNYIQVMRSPSTVTDWMRALGTICRGAALNNAPHGLYPDVRDVGERLKLLTSAAMKAKTKKQHKNEKQSAQAQRRRESDKQNLRSQGYKH